MKTFPVIVRDTKSSNQLTFYVPSESWEQAAAPFKAQLHSHWRVVERAG